MSDALAALRGGGKRALSEALARVERAPDAPDTLALLDAAYGAARAHVVGLTGPPGVGKSTLLGALIQHWRGQGRSVGAVAVDPTSRLSGGALLGDRVRIQADPGDAGVFVRSLAARDRLGGLADLALPAVVLLRALYDLAAVETVGVGQSETEVADIADTVVFCVQPGAGDGLQYMKAGIAEIPDIVAVTKADLGDPARRTASDVRAALGLNQGGPWKPPVLAVSAAKGEAMDELADALDAHARFLAGEGRRERRRLAQAERWLAAAVRERFGRQGLARAGACGLAPGESPFARLAAVAARLAP